MSEDILAYRLLKSANLSNEQKQKQIIKATLPELQYDSMKDQLKKTFNDSSWHIPFKEEGLIKTENTLLAAGFDNLQLTYFTKIMHQILLNTIHIENNNMITFTQKTMMTSNHLVENTTPSIKETIIAQLFTKLTHTEQTNNPHHGFSLIDSMLLNLWKHLSLSTKLPRKKKPRLPLLTRNCSLWDRLWPSGQVKKLGFWIKKCSSTWYWSNKCCYWNIMNEHLHR